MPVEIRYGLGFNGKFSGNSSSPSTGDLDNWIWYDQEVSALDQEAKNRKLNPVFVKEKLQWLDKIYMANKRYAIFKEPFFTNKLVEHWNSFMNHQVCAPGSAATSPFLCNAQDEQDTQKMQK